MPTGVVHDITMPKLGETVTEGTIGSWRKQVGDTVEFDDPLFEVTTDKVDSEIPSPYDGVMLEILVGAGRNRTGRHRAGPHRRARRSAAGAPRAAPPRRRRPRPRRAAPAAPATAARPPADRNGRMLSPLVRRLVAEAGLDVAAITGSGAGGRIRREDVERAIAAGTGRAQAPAAAAAGRPRPPRPPRRPRRPRPPRRARRRPPRRGVRRPGRPARPGRRSSPACAWRWRRA